MSEFLETTVDKFTFRVATDRYYHSEGVWAQAEGNRVRIGLSDYLQRRSGDVAFAEVRPEGTVLAFDDEVAVIETIKADISLVSPVVGRVVEINPAMETAPRSLTDMLITFALPSVSVTSSSENVVVRIAAGDRPSLVAALCVGSISVLSSTSRGNAIR